MTKYGDREEVKSDKFGIEIENEGDRRDSRGSKVHMPTRDTS